MKNNKKILINFSLYFLTLFIIIFVGVNKIFADTVNVGYITNNTDLLLGIPNLSAPVSLPSGTTNSYGNIYQIWLNINNITINKDYIYNIEISTPNAKLTNINRVSIVSSSQVCNFLGLSDASGGYPHVYFQCLSDITNGTLSITLENSSGSTDPITTTSSFRWNYTFLSYYTDDDDIDLGPVITNQTQNTQNIIDNQNANNDALIENDNKNTQELQDTFTNQYTTCEEQTISNPNKNNSGYYLNNSGGLTALNNWNVSDYYQVSKNNTYTITRNTTAGGVPAYCLYDINKNLISCTSYSTNTTFSITPTQNGYIRFSIYNLSNWTISGNICSNKLDEQTNAINGLNDNINDDNTDEATSEASDFFSEFNTNTFGLTSIITSPLNLIQSLTSKSCTPLHLPLPYLDNKYLDLPCMTTIYSEHFGTFFTLYQTITYGIIAYWVCVRIFNHVKDFKNPEHDEIEVVDL